MSLLALIGLTAVAFAFYGAVPALLVLDVATSDTVAKTASGVYHNHERRLILGGPEGLTTIAKMPDYGHDGQSEANARLIAAAPEMFAALKIANAAINPTDRGGISLAAWNDRLKDASQAIMSALIKAERGR